MTISILTIIKIYIIVYLSFEWAIDQQMLQHSDFLILQVVPLLLFMFLTYKKRGAINIKPISITVLFPMIVILSSLVNEIDFISLLLNVRWLLFPFFIYLIIINLNLNDKELKNIVVFVFWIGIIHIPIAFLKYFVLQMHGEDTLGLIQHSGSSYVVAIGFAFILSFFRFNSKTVNILLIVGFIFIAIASGKRALVFILPLVFIVSIYLNVKDAKEALTQLIIMLVFIPIFIYVLVRLFPTLNPDREVGGKFDLDYVIEYAFEYESIERLSEYGETTSRVGTTMYLVEVAVDSPISVFLGLGGNQFSKINGADGIFPGVEYGVNGLTWISTQFGLVSAFIWFYYFYKFKNIAIEIIKRSKDNFWVSYAKSIYIVALIMSFFQFLYSPEYKNTIFISIVYLLLGVTYVYNKNIYKSKGLGYDTD